MDAGTWPRPPPASRPSQPAAELSALEGRRDRRLERGAEGPHRPLWGASRPSPTASAPSSACASRTAAAASPPGPRGITGRPPGSSVRWPRTTCSGAARWRGGGGGETARSAASCEVRSAFERVRSRPTLRSGEAHAATPCRIARSDSARNGSCGSAGLETGRTRAHDASCDRSVDAEGSPPPPTSASVGRAARAGRQCAGKRR